MSGCGSNSSTVNKTFIIEPLQLTGGSPTLSACTTMYTNLVQSCSGDTSIQLGTGLITFSGDSLFQNITASTIEAITYLSGGTNLLDIFSSTDTFVTGGTAINYGDVLSLIRNDGANVIVSGLTGLYTTGATLINDTVYFDRNDQLSAYTLDLSTLDINDTFLTGGTFTNNILTLIRNDDQPIVITGFTDFYVTAGTYNSLTQNIDFSGNGDPSTFSVDVSALIDDTNTFITGFTYDGSNTFTITRSDNVSFPATFNTVSGLTINGDLIVTGNTVGIPNFYTTGATMIDNVIFYDRNDILSAYTVNLSAFSTTDLYITGTTFNNGTYDLSLFRNDGTTFTESLAVLASDVYVLSGVYDPNTGIVTYTNTTGGTFDVSGFTTGMTDSYTTDAYLSGSSVVFNNNIQGINFYNVDLEPLLSGKTDVSLFNTYTANTETELNNKIDSGVNLGGGNEIFSGKSGTTFVFNTLSGGSNTTITKVGNVQRIDVAIPPSINTFVTGGTLSNEILTLTRNDDVDINITGFTDLYTTGATLINDTVYFDRNDQLSAYTLDLSSFTDDVYTTGVTQIGAVAYFDRNDQLSAYTVDYTALFDSKTNLSLFNQHTGDTSIHHTLTELDDRYVNVTGDTINGDLTVTGDTLLNTLSAVTISADTYYGDGSNLTGIPDFYTTGVTIINNVAYFDRTDTLSAYTLNLDTYVNTDTYITGATFENNDLTLTNNTGGTITVNIDNFTGLTVNGVISATTISGDTFYGDGSNLVCIPKWTGPWTAGTYDKFNITRDGVWLMIANTETAERAAPQLVGNKETTIPDDQTWNIESYSGTPLTGQRYYFTEDGEVTKLRAYTPAVGASIKYRALMVNRTNPSTPIVEITPEFDGVDDEWVTVTLGSRLILSGSTFDVFLMSKNSSTNTEFNHTWDYGGRNQSGQPASDDWNRNNQDSIIRLNKTDNTSTDRTSELDSVLTDTILRFSEAADLNNFVEYVVLDKTELISTFEYDVVLNDIGGDDFLIGTNTVVSFSIPVPADTDFVEAPAYWSNTANTVTWATISGITATTLDDEVLNDNAYGVDITFQKIVKSDDWDFMAVSDLTGSGSLSIDNFTTGSTLIGDIAYFDRTNVLSAYTLDLSGLVTSGGSGDNFYTTAATQVNDIIYFDRTDTLSAYSVTLSGITATSTTDKVRVTGTRDRNNQSNAFLRYEDGLPFNVVPYRPYKDSTITNVVASGRDLDTWQAHILTGTSIATDSIYSLTLNSERAKFDNNINLSVSSGDTLYLYMSGSGIAYPKIDIYIE